jgi:thioredoxin 1
MGSKLKGDNFMSEQIRNVSADSFESEVLQSEKAVLVDFWAEWCGPCRMMLPVVESRAAEYESSASVVKLNVDENPSVAQRYGVRGIPTLILFKDGEEVERVVGASTKDSLARLIDKHASVAASR